MNYAALALVASPVVLKLINFAQYLRVKNWNAVATQAAAWLGGVGVTFLFAHSNYSAAVALNGLNAYSLVIAGISLGSLASVGVDGLKALDATQSAAKPDLLAKRKRPKTARTKN